MAVYFFDSSGIVKRYMSETGSGWVIGITDPSVHNLIYIARITGAEVLSAITRRQRSGDLAATVAATAIADFPNDFSSQYRIVEVAPALVTRAMTLVEAHALRGYDAIQLAAALTVHTQRLALGMSVPTLVSADADLNTAASAEGITVDDPNLHP